MTRHRMTTPQGTCCHTDDCTTGMHGAAFRLLREFDKNQPPSELSEIEYVEIDPDGIPYEGHTKVTEEFIQTNYQVHVGYWWGNSNLFFGVSLDQWNAALVKEAT